MADEQGTKRSQKKERPAKKDSTQFKRGGAVHRGPDPIKGEKKDLSQKSVKTPNPGKWTWQNEPE